MPPSKIKNGYNVLPDPNGGWIVKVDNSDNIFIHTKTKQQATDLAKNLVVGEAIAIRNKKQQITKRGASLDRIKVSQKVASKASKLLKSKKTSKTVKLVAG